MSSERAGRIRDFLPLGFGRGMGRYVRVVGNVQHNPDTVDDLVATVGVEEARHVAVFAWQTELPRVQLAIQLTVFLLPSLDVREGADVHGLLQETVDLGENADDLDVVAERAKILGLVHLAKIMLFAFDSLEPSGVDWLVASEEIVSAWQLSINLLIIQSELECRCNGRISVQQVDHPE